MAYTMTPDLNHKFDLALMLNLVEDAYKIAEQ
jgi:coatomer subunit beta'